MTEKSLRSKTERVQCPYRTTKYHCQYGGVCKKEMAEHDGLPSRFNECPVAQRQLNGRPWRNEKKDGGSGA